MSKYNLTTDATNNFITIAYLGADNVTVIGTDYKSFSCLRDELDGWWFDRVFETEYNKKLLFANLVNVNGSAIGVTTQAAVTALLLAAISV